MSSIRCGNSRRALVLVDNLDRRLGPEIVVPARRPLLPEASPDDGKVVAEGNAQQWASYGSARCTPQLMQRRDGLPQLASQLGGDSAAGALPLTRLAAGPWGILWPGFSTSMPGSKARSKEIFYVLSREHQLAGRAAVTPSLAQPRQSRRAGRSSLSPSASRAAPSGQSAAQVGSQPGSPGEAKRGKGNTTAFSASAEIFGPGTKSWADTRTSVVPIYRSGAAPGGAAKQQFPEAWRLHGKLRQTIGETELWRALSRRGKMAG